MKRKRLSRSERRDLNRDTGAVAENIAASAYDRYSAFQDSGEFDLATESGSIAEVKSTLSRLGNGNRGRFRLFKPQHEQLVRKDRDGSAFYIFVLFEISNLPALVPGFSLSLMFSRRRSPPDARPGSRTPTHAAVSFRPDAGSSPASTLTV